jgi:hypothetical protein
MVQQVAPYGGSIAAFVSVIGSFEFDSSFEFRISAVIGGGSSFEFRHSNFAPS